ncbi:uncharacterized protein DUF3182 [Paucimonas lemoignei]|uniref:Uncharacterized protein DUF3182 n=1 Tax=Paucimonas lemoignei TaxID=29443 RepID=A0A4R3HWI2_PAULE|nr:DUF3182 family protein [Paucimonas lemoignei]TCS36943.1 uncharacterized protein DUF3182 [Paucimonas lemoignei]
MIPHASLAPNTRKESADGGILLLYSCQQRADPSRHEYASQLALARKLATLLSYEFGGEFDPARHYAASPYFVPVDTLESLEQAHALGIHGNAHLFGGVVPHPFVATKVITHPLVAADAPAPAGWSHELGKRIADVVLPGYSVFSRDDAMRAATDLLNHGAVRMKKAGGRGGCDQLVIRDQASLESALRSVDEEEWAQSGVVFERNLTQATTHSIGQVQVGTLLATYCGMQTTTRDHRGNEVYGGSHLTVVRGGFDALLELDLNAGTRTAVAQARTYHAAALTAFPGMFASRCNYDVAQGYDDQRQWHSGVLEQSWRIGGASGAEIAALEAFQATPGLDVVRTSTTELYQANPVLPDDAMVYCQQVDPVTGPIVKYARIEAYA